MTRKVFLAYLFIPSIKHAQENMMENSIRKLATEEQKAKLRKVKSLPSKAKAIMYSGAKTGPAVTIQLGSDIALYGLWEALLYAESYEADGHYAEGTVKSAFEAAIGVKAVKA